MSIIREDSLPGDRTVTALNQHLAGLLGTSNQKDFISAESIKLSINLFNC